MWAGEGRHGERNAKQELVSGESNQGGKDDSRLRGQHPCIPNASRAYKEGVGKKGARPNCDESARVE